MAALQARIKIDLDRVTGDVDPRIFGGFIEHLGRCIYGGIYDEGSQLADARGFRTDVSWPWSEVHGARIQERGPAGVAIDVKGSGVDPVVPITAFDVPAEQLVEEIARARAAARR